MPMAKAGSAVDAALMERTPFAIDDTKGGDDDLEDNHQVMDEVDDFLEVMIRDRGR